jgi:DNA replication protein DnaC
MMTSPAATTGPTHNLAAQLAQIGLKALAQSLQDFITQATKGRWSPHMLLEQLSQLEVRERSRRSLEVRTRLANIGSFKPMADFDWSWPKKVDREAIERALTLDFIQEGRNLVLVGANGLGKTMIAKNIAHAAVLAGHSVLFRSASDLLVDLQCDWPELRRKRLKKYIRPHVLCIDEVGYLSYDDKAADLLYELVNRRYERRSIVLTTNRAFKDWSQVFPNASCITTLLDRLLHHADVTAIEGQSYRVRESEQETTARRKKR